MKKIFFAILVVICFYIMIGNVSSLVIPEDALRIRVIANSNSEYDQKIKAEIKEDIQYKLYDLLKDVKGTNEARKIINQNIPYLDLEIKNKLSNLNYKKNYTINYGLNYFPSKEYKGTTYQEGYYESLVITLGEGKGDNWWCVLFPPLCLLEASDSDNIEYTTYVKELIDKYL